MINNVKNEVMYGWLSSVVAASEIKLSEFRNFLHVWSMDSSIHEQPALIRLITILTI
jgi:hypothetical protein